MGLQKPMRAQGGARAGAGIHTQSVDIRRLFHDYAAWKARKAPKTPGRARRRKGGRKKVLMLENRH